MFGSYLSLPRPIQGSSQAATRHKLLAMTRTGAEKFGTGPGVQCTKF